MLTCSVRYPDEIRRMTDEFRQSGTVGTTSGSAVPYCGATPADKKFNIIYKQPTKSNALSNRQISIIVGAAGGGIVMGALASGLCLFVRYKRTTKRMAKFSSLSRGLPEALLDGEGQEPDYLLLLCGQILAPPHFDPVFSLCACKFCFQLIASSEALGSNRKSIRSTRSLKREEEQRKDRERDRESERDRKRQKAAGSQGAPQGCSGSARPSIKFTLTPALVAPPLPNLPLEEEGPRLFHSHTTRGREYGKYAKTDIIDCDGRGKEGEREGRRDAGGGETEGKGESRRVRAGG
eukprot:749531-Hanusia_phi.AAC.1